MVDSVEQFVQRLGTFHLSCHQLTDCPSFAKIPEPRKTGRRPYLDRLTVVQGY
jgi:hypothetical protein